MGEGSRRHHRVERYQQVHRAPVLVDRQAKGQRERSRAAETACGRLRITSASSATTTSIAPATGPPRSPWLTVRVKAASAPQLTRLAVRGDRAFALGAGSHARGIRRPAEAGHRRRASSRLSSRRWSWPTSMCSRGRRPAAGQESVPSEEHAQTARSGRLLVIVVTTSSCELITATVTLSSARCETRSARPGRAAAPGPDGRGELDRLHGGRRVLEPLGQPERGEGGEHEQRKHHSRQRVLPGARRPLATARTEAATRCSPVPGRSAARRCRAGAAQALPSRAKRSTVSERSPSRNVSSDSTSSGAMLPRLHSSPSA